MKTLRNLLFAVAIIAATVALAPTHATASNYHNGYTTPAGYTYRDGFWWKNGKQHYRLPKWRKSCSCGYRCRKHFYWQYYRVRTVSYTDKNWRSQLLDIAAARDKVEGQLRISANEQNEFIQAVNALGLNFGWQGYGMAPFNGASAYAQAFSAAYAPQEQQYANYVHQPTQQGTTVYGFSTVADVYGDVDLGALYQQSAQLASDANRYAGTATTNHQALVEKQGTHQARVATILAEAQSTQQKLQADAQATATRIQATKPQAEAHIKTERWTLEIPQNGGSPRLVPAPAPVPAPADTSAAPILQLIEHKCLHCHSGATSDPENANSLDLSDLSKITVEQGNSILERITTTDENLLMPKGGPRLTDKEIQMFYRAATPVDAQ